LERRYSASGLKTFKSCRLKYNLYYNKEIKIERPITADTIFGLLVHEVAENFNGSNHKEMLEIVNKHKDNLTREFKLLLPQTLENMFNWLKKYSEYPSVNEGELELKNDDYWLYGLADKLFIENKMFVDYKTAKVNMRDRHIFQMKLYNLILSKKWNCEPKEIKCIIYYPRIDEEDKILFNNNEIYLFEKELKKNILEIETNTNWSPSESYFCKWCEYKESGHCPIWKNK
jgi:CRISPR/Cas system-associated exonuclease Cas4 (RecB family)